jgi:hypothetical protein
MIKRFNSVTNVWEVGYYKNNTQFLIVRLEEV